MLEVLGGRVEAVELGRLRIVMFFSRPKSPYYRFAGVISVLFCFSS